MELSMLRAGLFTTLSIDHATCVIDNDEMQSDCIGIEFRESEIFARVGDILGEDTKEIARIAIVNNNDGSGNNSSSKCKSYKAKRALITATYEDGIYLVFSRSCVYQRDE